MAESLEGPGRPRESVSSGRGRPAGSPVPTGHMRRGLRAEFGGATGVSRALSLGGVGREADLRGLGTRAGETGSAVLVSLVHVAGREQRRGSCRGLGVCA